MLKLNLGCGIHKIHGFINIDNRSDLSPDVVLDISKVSLNYKDVNLIYACHVIEHFPFRPSKFAPITIYDLLNDWYKSLAIGGILRISTPDMEQVCKRYFVTGDVKELWPFINGGQHYETDYHLSSFDLSLMSRILTDIGFKEIKRYNYKNTEHSFIDDHSQAFLPHLDKTGGMQMSLNIEATK